MLSTLLTALLVAIPAPVTVRTYAPEHVASGALSFRVTGLRPGDVRRARLLHHEQIRSLDTARVRAAIAAGTVVRAPIVPTTPDPRAARLVVYTADTAELPEPDPVTRAPDAAPCGADISAFRPGAWPGPCWRPYADDSPFNEPLPAHPRLDRRSAAYVRELTRRGGPSDLEAGDADTSSDWQHPTYFARPGDPRFRVHCWEPGPPCEIEGVTVRIPRGARAAGSWKLGRDGDGHMTVVDVAPRMEYDFWNVTTPPDKVRPGRGGHRVLRVGWGGMTRIDGDGLGSNATAAAFGNLAGIIRVQELRAGEIDHALFMVIDCSSAHWVYPARDHGSVCRHHEDAIPFGTRFQLDMSDDEIRALDVPSWKRTILRAMAHYGMFAGDTGGSPWDLEFESSSTYTSFGYADPLVAYARESGIAPRDGRYPFDLAGGVDWARRLRVVAPCVSRRSC